MSKVYVALYCLRQRREVHDMASRKKTVIITGGNRGIGLAAAKELAATDRWSVVLACRSVPLAEEAIKSIGVGSANITAVHLDLADLRSINSFAQEWRDRPIDCLALNAGIHTGSRSTPLYTSQGYELTVGTNHIGHFHLAMLLLRNVERSPAGRILFVASSLHDNKNTTNDLAKSMLGDLAGLEAGFKTEHTMISGRQFSSDQAYKDSKLCNVMTALELARRLQARQSRATCNCMAPGFIPTTGLFREYNSYAMYFFSFFMRDVLGVAVTEEEGGRRLAYMIDSADLDGVSGAYYAQNRKTGQFEPAVPSAEATDAIKAARLWAATEKLIADT